MHRKLIAALALCGTLTVASFGQQPEDLLKPIQTFFAGIAARNAAQMREPFQPNAQLLFMRETGPSQSSIEQFSDRLATSGTTKMEESLHDPVIQVKNDLGIVWAPTVFKIDGKIDHCAIDHFVLVKQNGKWLITSFYNTRAAC